MMYDTAGNEIYEPGNCDCGFTGGCEKCNPANYKTDKSVTFSLSSNHKNLALSLP